MHVVFNESVTHETSWLKRLNAKVSSHEWLSVGAHKQGKKKRDGKKQAVDDREEDHVVLRRVQLCRREVVKRRG